MKIIFKIAIGLLLTACGGTVERNHHAGSNSVSTPGDISYGNDQTFTDVPPEAGAPSVSTGGSSSIQAAGTGGTNDIAVGGEAAGGVTDESDAGGAGGEKNSVGDFSPTGNCLLTAQTDLSIYTYYDALLGGPHGLMIAGGPYDQNAGHDFEFQYWDVKNNVPEQGKTQFAEYPSWLIAGGGSSDGFLAMASWTPYKDDYLGEENPPAQPTVFDADGDMKSTTGFDWGDTSIYEGMNLAAAENQLFWDRKIFSDQVTHHHIMRTQVAHGVLGESTEEYTWTENETTEDIGNISVAMVGTKLLLSVWYFHIPISPEGDQGADQALIFTDTAVPLAKRKVTRVDRAGDWTQVLPASDGFNVITTTYDSNIATNTLTSFSFDGEVRRVMKLPDFRRIAPFGNGFATISAPVAADHDDRDFTFSVLSHDGVVLQTLPFQSENRYYDLALSSLVPVGDHQFAFSWSASSLKQSTLAFFSCE